MCASNQPLEACVESRCCILQGPTGSSLNPGLLVRPALNGAPSADFMSGGGEVNPTHPVFRLQLAIARLSSLDASAPLLFLKAF